MSNAHFRIHATKLQDYFVMAKEMDKKELCAASFFNVFVNFKTVFSKPYNPYILTVIVKKFFKIYSLSWQSSASDLTLRFPLCYYFDETTEFLELFLRNLILNEKKIL